MLQEVLSAVEAVTLDTLNREVPSILKRSVDLKHEINRYMEDTYVKYIQRPASTQHLLDATTKLVDHANVLKEKASELTNHNVPKSRNLVKQHTGDLEAIECILQVTDNICKLNEALIALRWLHKEMAYDMALVEIEKFGKLYNALTPEEQVPAIEKLHMLFMFAEDRFMQDLRKIVENNFTCSEQKSKEVTIYSIDIKHNNTEAQQALLALSQYREDIFELDLIVRFLWDCMFTQIVQKSTQIKSKKDSNGVSLQVVVNGDQKLPYSHVFGQLIELSAFLHTYFNYELKENTCLGYIGTNIRDNLSELIIKFCLDDTIPTRTEGLEGYKEVIADTKELQKKLVESGLFEENSTTILDHANHVDVLFINKKCAKYQKLAAEFMKKDLHDMETVGIPYDPSKFSFEQFPQCSVSKSALELLHLVRHILLKATKSSELCAGRLLIIAKNSLLQYPGVIQEHHRKLLQTIPQQVAIFYNNCNYISYEINEPRWCEVCLRLPKSLGEEHFDYVKTLLVNSGEKLFEDYVQQQKSQIEDTVKTSGIDSQPSCKDVDPKAEKHIRQCLRQQELLKTVWQKVLNYHIYNKTMGGLLDSLSASLIACVLAIEDISSNAAEQLSDIFKLVMTRGPKLFTEPKEVHMYVENWHRLSELLFVLTSDLAKIHDRWADGKGPLALHFKPQEMRALIRALFQNTDKRAEILMQICDI